MHYTQHEKVAVSQAWISFIVLGTLILCDSAFVSLHVFSYLVLGRIPSLFNLDLEGNPPAWWSSIQLFLAGLFLAMVAIRCCRIERGAWMLAFLAATFMFLSADEASSFHERIGTLLDAKGDGSHSFLPQTGNWIFILGLPMVLFMWWILAGLSSILAQVARTRTRLVIGLLFLFGGALGVEGLSNFVIPEPSPARETLTEALFIALEEYMEMIGGSILLWAGLLYAHLHWSMRLPLVPIGISEVFPEVEQCPASDGGPLPT